MDMKNETRLGLAIHMVQKALISAYEDINHLRPDKAGRQFLKWAAELESIRREVIRLFSKCRSDTNPHRTLWRGSAELQEGGWESFQNVWWIFCSSISGLPRSARLDRALYRDPKIKL